MRGWGRSRLQGDRTPAARCASCGTSGLVWQFGDALVCVRHRADNQEEFRCTTVELPVQTVRETKAGVAARVTQVELKDVVQAHRWRFQIPSIDQIWPTPPPSLATDC